VTVELNGDSWLTSSSLPAPHPQAPSGSEEVIPLYANTPEKAIKKETFPAATPEDPIVLSPPMARRALSPFEAGAYTRPLFGLT